MYAILKKNWGQTKINFLMVMVCIMVLNATFNNISVTSSDLFVEETGIPQEKTTDLPQFTDKL
jgi:hypothetical protein